MQNKAGLVAQPQVGAGFPSPALAMLNSKLYHITSWIPFSHYFKKTPRSERDVIRFSLPLSELFKCWMDLSGVREAEGRPHVCISSGIVTSEPENLSSLKLAER